MTSESTSFPTRLLQIDELTRSDHYLLNATDRCYFFGDYTARAGWSYSPTNNLIQNFKKPMERKGSSQWFYKNKAIADTAAVTFTISQTESITSTDSLTGAATYNPVFTDSLTSGDSFSASVTGGGTNYNDTITESIASNDTLAGQGIYNPVFSESLSANDSASASVGGTIYNETINELLTAEDGLSLQYVEGDVRGTPTFHWIFPKKEEEKKLEEELQEIEEQIVPKTVYSAEQMFADTIELQQLIKRKNELEAELFALKAKRKRNNIAITAIVLASPFTRIAA